MQIRTNQLIDNLLARTDKVTATVQKFKEISVEKLNYKKSPDKWSLLECIEHLNLYGDFYLPEIEKRILEQEKTTKNTIFKSGLVGGYFANLMQVKNGKIKKMKSPKDKNPANSTLSITIIDRFLKQQEKLKSLLILARNIDLIKTKTAISLTNFMKLRLGDTFRFFIYHIERHVLQAEQTQI